ncbi:MAG: hypothetical protein AAF730_07235, partial [Bacteroidota bacterium]
LGARRFGNVEQRSKRCLILDREQFRYQAYLSDLSGQDIKKHGDRPENAILAVRNWLSLYADALLPGGRVIAERHAAFLTELPALLAPLGIAVTDLIYNDYTTLMATWLGDNPWGRLR